jgi:probable rRNA maturation factor
MACLIYQKTKHSILPQRKIDDICQLVLETLGLEADVSLHLIGDRLMKKMNQEYRGKNKTTDVLSFGLEEKNKKKKNIDLGDIFISVPQIERQAKSLGTSDKEEFVLAWIHGILHLAGYDHQGSKEAEKMFSLQEDIWQKALNLL